MKVAFGDVLRELGVPEVCPNCRSQEWNLLGHVRDGLTDVWCLTCGRRYERRSNRDELAAGLKVLVDMLLNASTVDSELTRARRDVLRLYFRWADDVDGGTFDLQFDGLSQDHDDAPF